jgi:hypothetical protein
MPDEDKIEITQITENAFYYFKQDELKHKLLLIEDLDGAESSMYPLRELQSKRRISKTVTLKDSKGNLKTITLTVEGPVASAVAPRGKRYTRTTPTAVYCSTSTAAKSRTGGSWTTRPGRQPEPLTGSRSKRQGIYCRTCSAS